MKEDVHKKKKKKIPPVGAPETTRTGPTAEFTVCLATADWNSLLLAGWPLVNSLHTEYHQVYSNYSNPYTLDII